MIDKSQYSWEQQMTFQKLKILREWEKTLQIKSSEQICNKYLVSYGSKNEMDKKFITDE